MSGYAVVDVETTGIYPGKFHRVIEIGVVHVNATGQIEGQWDTLVNPERDLGGQSIHGISAASVLRAPRFAQISVRLGELLAGRVLVAHNLRFDVDFLLAEYDRLGVSVPVNAADGLCTMGLARSYLPGAGRSLADCCDAFGIRNDLAHRAVTDAVAAAELLSGYLRLDPDAPIWRRSLQRAESAAWPELAHEGAPWRCRDTAASDCAGFLSRLVRRLPDPDVAPSHHDYLAMIDRALIDRHISVTEADALLDVAAALSIDWPTAHRLHVGYVSDLARTAWADGVITQEERGDLAMVGALLGLSAEAVDAVIGDRPPVEASADAPGAGTFRLAAGNLIVFTGEMERPRADWEAAASARGLVPHSAVTKKVALVVAADPDSQSGKARKARQYEIPVVGEAAFERLLEELAA